MQEKMKIGIIAFIIFEFNIRYLYVLAVLGSHSVYGNALGLDVFARLLNNVSWALGIGWLSWIAIGPGMRFTLAQPLERLYRERLRPEEYTRELVTRFLRKRIISVEDAREILASLGWSDDKIEKLIEKKFRRPRIALLLDDLFQAVGLDKAEQYVKSLLNLLEYPLEPYDKMVILITSSEGLTRSRIGRHRWSTMYIMWNMSRSGFKELYDQIPKVKEILKNWLNLKSVDNPFFLRITSKIEFINSFTPSSK